jgi:hypothetical protein
LLNGFPPAPKTGSLSEGGLDSQHLSEEGAEMIANALLFTIAIFLAYGFWLLDQLKFMARYKSVLFHAYGPAILIFAGVLFINVFALALGISRRFFLQNTGRKLSHLDKQFTVGHVDMPVPTADEDHS